MAKYLETSKASAPLRYQKHKGRTILPTDILREIFSGGVTEQNRAEKNRSFMEQQGKKMEALLQPPVPTDTWCLHDWLTARSCPFTKKK